MSNSRISSVVIRKSAVSQRKIFFQLHTKAAVKAINLLWRRESTLLLNVAMISLECEAEGGLKKLEKCNL
jgi:hypothetical protein